MTAPPIVATLGTSAIQNNTITLSGNLIYLGTNSDSSEQVNEYGFIYSSNISLSTNLWLGESGVEKVAGGRRSNTGIYSLALLGPSLCTTHYFRAFAVSDGGTNYGEISNFPPNNFTLTGTSDGEQNNLLCPYTTVSYTVPLSHLLSYSLTVEADSNVSDNVTVYEGTSTDPLYIRKGPFSISTTDSFYSNVAFSGINNGTRYMVLPLSNNSHQMLLSNGSDQNQSYSLNLTEYSGSNPQTSRLLTAPQKIGYYDSTNGPRFFWGHVPPNKGLEVSLDDYRVDRVVAVRLNNSGSQNTVYSAGSTNTQTLHDSTNDLRYIIVAMDDPLVSTDNFRQTNFRLIVHFSD